MSLSGLLIDGLRYVLFPAWLLAGLGDYLCHRRTDIEHTSGFRESLLHLLQAFEIGLALCAGLFLEINALVLAALTLCIVAHTFTAIWDTTYTAGRRCISPLEQHLHAWLEILPVVALGIVSALHWSCSLGSRCEASTEWLALKDPPLPLGVIAGIFLPLLAIDFAPLAKELLRTGQARGAKPGGDTRPLRRSRLPEEIT